ncbi:hypothetical protein R6Q59_030551 [Mikania micrantha]
MQRQIFSSGVDAYEEVRVSRIDGTYLDNNQLKDFYVLLKAIRVTLSIKYSGYGFVSQELYLHEFFNVSIKLPAYYTIVSALLLQKDIRSLPTVGSGSAAVISTSAMNNKMDEPNVENLSSDESTGREKRKIEQKGCQKETNQPKEN